MVHVIVKQDDGLWAIWSTVVDRFLMDDATKEDVFDFELLDMMKHTRHSLERFFEDYDLRKSRTTYNEYKEEERRRIQEEGDYEKD